MSEYKLSALKVGEAGEVACIETDDGMKRRLWDLGFTQGTKVQCIQKSPMGDPVAYEVRGTIIAVRNQDAEKIFISR